MPSMYLYIPDILADWEPGYVLAELHSGRYLKDPALRYEVVLCGRTMDPVVTMGGLVLTPYVLFEKIQPGNKDLVILRGTDTWLDPKQGPVITKIRSLLEEGVYIAAICGATLALADAGLLDHRPHTSNDPAALKIFCPGYHGETYYVNEPAVTAGNLITASGLAPVEFVYQVFRMLSVMKPETLNAWYGLFSTRSTKHFHALMESLG